MSTFLVTAALAVSLAGQPAATYRAAATATGGVATLGDLADLSRLPPALKARAQHLVIALIPAGVDRISLPAGGVGDRARRLMPALSPWLPLVSDETIEVRASRATTPAIPADGPAACARVTAPLDQGAYVSPADLTAAPCLAKSPRPAFRLAGAGGFLKAARPLVAGDIVPAPRDWALADVKPGQVLRVSTTVGVVRLERQVVAVQPARRGQAVFVRAAAGAPFAAVLPAGAP